jgi:hypothetical protein
MTDSLYGVQPVTATKVLFIGNSHTYLHYMPQMVLQLSQSADLSRGLEVAQSTGKGVSLKWHWSNPGTRELIAARKWDYVILQERSGGALEARESMFAHARLLDAAIKKQGAQTVFYMTWANRHRPQTQHIIEEAYGQISRELDAVLAPVGRAWENCLKADPGFGLHHADDRHANPSGSYLSACVFHSVLFRVSPEGLPGTLYANDRLLVELTEDQARFLQQIAYQTGTGIP